jgi:DNA-binding transcriptional LysR family regulator
MVYAMYDLSHLRTFLAVSQTLSFTQAARRLGLRQSTVSQHVRRLEDATGRQLFTRDTHSVELTEDGEAMLGFARRILEVQEQASAFFTGTGCAAGSASARRRTSSSPGSPRSWRASAPTIPRSTWS